MARPAASSLALLILSPDESRSSDTFSWFCDAFRFRCALREAMLVLITCAMAHILVSDGAIDAPTGLLTWGRRWPLSSPFALCSGKPPETFSLWAERIFRSHRLLLSQKKHTPTRKPARRRRQRPDHAGKTPRLPTGNSLPAMHRRHGRICNPAPLSFTVPEYTPRDYYRLNRHAQTFSSHPDVPRHRPSTQCRRYPRGTDPLR